MTDKSGPETVDWQMIAEHFAWHGLTRHAEEAHDLFYGLADKLEGSGDEEITAADVKMAYSQLRYYFTVLDTLASALRIDPEELDPDRLSVYQEIGDERR